MGDFDFIRRFLISWIFFFFFFNIGGLEKQTLTAAKNEFRFLSEEVTFERASLCISNTQAETNAVKKVNACWVAQRFSQGVRDNRGL